jgi:hypothetical protein
VQASTGPPPRHGSEDSVSMYERGIGSHDLDQVCVKHIDISCEPADTTTTKPHQHCVFQHRGGVLGGNLLIAELAANSRHLSKSLNRQRVPLCSAGRQSSECRLQQQTLAPKSAIGRLAASGRRHRSPVSTGTSGSGRSGTQSTLRRPSLRCAESCSTTRAAVPFPWATIVMREHSDALSGINPGNYSDCRTTRRGSAEMKAG